MTLPSAARDLAAMSLLAALVGCTGTSATHPAVAPAHAGPTGDLAESRLRALLLQPADLAGLPQRRTYAATDLSTVTTPQLAPCGGATADPPHEVANVIAESPVPGAVRVFELLNAYGDPAAALASFSRARAALDACRAHPGAGFAVASVGSPILAGAAVFQYRVVTADTVSGDVRTFLRAGRFTVLLTGYGRPPGGLSGLAFQLDLAGKALARLGGPS